MHNLRICVFVRLIDCYSDLLLLLCCCTNYVLYTLRCSRPISTVDGCISLKYLILSYAVVT